MTFQRLAVVGALSAAFALAGCNTEDNGPMIENKKSLEETQADVQNPFGVKQRVRGKGAVSKDVR